MLGVKLMLRKHSQALIFLYTVERKQKDMASLPCLQDTFPARSLSAKLFLHLSITQQVLLWLQTEFTVFSEGSWVASIYKQALKAPPRKQEIKPLQSAETIYAASVWGNSSICLKL